MGNGKASDGDDEDDEVDDGVSQRVRRNQCIYSDLTGHLVYKGERRPRFQTLQGFQHQLAKKNQ